MVVYRALVALFGAVPATVLGSLAAGVTFGGLRALASADLSGGVFMVWGALGLAGVAGFWLAAIEGPFPRGAAWLIGCGLIADAVLIGLTVRGGLSSGMPLRLTTTEVVYCLLAVSPFVVGALYVVRCLLGSRPEPAQ